MTKDNIARILEAFAYIAENITFNKKNNMYNVLKVFYLADKLHMDRYGRFIFEDKYAALPKGPVPSRAYDLMKNIKTGQPLPHGLTSPIHLESNYNVLADRKANLDYFSGSDLICIDEVINISKNKDLGSLSHDNAWKNTSPNQIMTTESILSTLENSKELIHLYKNRYA
ncbi:Panacea domain-containing protein [Acinetobacter terrae]|nr:Panacea domain-containing protein [Acinetobacter terrae]